MSEPKAVDSFLYENQAPIVCSRCQRGEYCEANEHIERTHRTEEHERAVLDMVKRWYNTEASDSELSAVVRVWVEGETNER